VWIGDHAPGADATREMFALALAVEERLGLPSSNPKITQDEADLAKAAAPA
jgi:hypothetical protein